MSIRRVEFEVLRKRALHMVTTAENAFENGFYDVSCFLAEQALQLYLKAMLLKLLGGYPRTHSIRRLLGELSKLVDSRLEEFCRVNRVRLSALEDAYLMARYFVKPYYREDAEDMIKLVRDVIRLLDEVTGS